MTPKEKAHELIKKFMPYCLDCNNTDNEASKLCALVAVNEIIKSNPIEPNNSKPFGVKIQSVRQNFIDADNFWLMVKQELELL